MTPKSRSLIPYEASQSREKTLKVDAVGDVRIRAGMYIPLYLPEQQIQQYMLIDECSHSWDGSGHKMSLTLKVI